MTSLCEMCVFHSGSRQCAAIPGTDTNWNSHYQRGKESVWICLVSLVALPQQSVIKSLVISVI